MSAALSTALAFARNGFAVVPLWWPREGKCACGKSDCRSPGKHPVAQIDPPRGPKIAPNGILSATTDSGIIKTWWRLLPEANLGVSAAGLVVLDIDVRHDGLESLAALEKEHGPMPDTWSVKTGSGGQHFYFRRPDGLDLSLPIIAENLIKAGREPPFGSGIDIPAYTIAPPSMHACGRPYAWDNHPADYPIADCPEWITERLSRARTEGHRGESRNWQQALAGPITEYRDAEAAAVAGKLLRAVSLPAELAFNLLHAWNARYCRPPLPDHEINQIFERIARREEQRLEREMDR